MSTETEFAAFWKDYPVKRDKLAARKAYDKARKSGATQAELIAGLDEYRRHKPGWQEWKHAASWLNKGGWMDEWTPSPASPSVARLDWFAECAQMHAGECGLSQQRHAIRKATDAQRQAS